MNKKKRIIAWGARLLVCLIQKVFEKLWNAGLFENVDALPRQFFKKLAKKCRRKAICAELSTLRSQLINSPKNRHVQFHTSDGVLIDGMMFNAGRKKVILFIPGIGSFYERIGDFGSVSYRFYTFFNQHFPDHSLLSFNNRGIGESDGHLNLEHCPRDTIAAYSYLQNVCGYDLDAILLYTHSLGGLHATQGAGAIQQQFPQAALSAVSDRSFGQLASLVRAFFKNSLFGKISAGLVSKLGMNLSAQTAWETLKGRKVVIVSKYDRAIPYEKSAFCHAIQSGTVIYLEGSQKEIDHHTRSFSRREAQQIVLSISSSKFPLIQK